MVSVELLFPSSLVAVAIIFLVAIFIKSLIEYWPF